jgi:non-ribosomal peptide synthetase component F/surfactin synthase thioesterase subunit
MKNIKSIVPLLPAQQLMLSATLKEKIELYVQQLLFEVKGYSHFEISKALDKLIDSYECFRSLILYEGLKQPVWVSKDDVRPTFNLHKINSCQMFEFIDVIRTKGFNFQQEACIRFDWIETEEKNHLCITNHHILFDGWGKQVILRDFIRALKFPNSYLTEKQNKSWYEAWSNLDHKKALDVYQNYLTPSADNASITQISSLKQENLEHKTSISIDIIQRASKNLGLTGAELVNFCWSIFISIWTQNERVQFGVVKQNGLIDQVKNGFGMGIQTLPYQFQVDFKATIREQLIHFKNRERAVSEASFANSLDPIFNQFTYDFLIAFENYPLDSSLGSVENNFNLLFSYDRSEFPLSLAISPYPDKYDFDWHFNTKFHCSDQIIFLANQFIYFLELFELNVDSNPLELCEKWFESLNKIKSFEANFDKYAFIKKLEDNLNVEQRKIHDNFSEYFRTSINRIWIYGDKHENMIPLISAAWTQNVEVMTINEKESSSFLEKLLELKKPDLIFSSIDDNRFLDSISLHQSLVGINIERKSEKKVNNIALSICTSGSTGEPKVVQLTLENIILFFHAWDEKLPWRENECFASIAHPAFDVGAAELMFPFWKGWKIKLIDKTILSDSKRLNQELSDISAFHMVPSLLESWIDGAESDEKERMIMTGGDKVPPHLFLKLQKKFSKAKLFQLYGPAECSVFASGFENKGQFEKNILPLGNAFKHADLVLFGEKNLPIAPFQEGEIIVIGPCVGAGYSNQDNTQKFIDFREQRAFKTGDFGFKDADGNLFFRGRKDSQLKINGQRIELTRIESALSEWSSIENWVVVPNGNILFSFAKSDHKTLPKREKLQYWLPFYAIPQHIEILDEFPLNKNGKVDQQQLLQHGISALSNIKHSITINPKIESCIIDLFKDKKLNFSIGWYANGLNSIDALKLAGILKTKHKVSIELNQILGTENLFKLCQSQANSINQELNLMVIEVGQKVYSTASRLIFLSESDDQFFKSYWISSGVKLSADFDLRKIKKWVNEQTNLHLGVDFNKSEYFWKRSEVQLHEFEVMNEVDFINKVENTFSEIDSTLFLTFIGKSKDEKYLAFKVHHALLDGLGLELVWEKLYDDLKNNQIKPIQLIAPKEDKIELNFWENYLNDVEVTRLAFERPNSSIPSVNRINIELSLEERRIIDDLCSKHNCSLFESGLMLFAKMLTLFKPKNQAIGIPVNIGEYFDSNHISAMSVNILPFKTEHEKIEDILVNWREIFSKRYTPFSEIAQIDKTQKNGIPFFNCTYLYHSQKADLKEFKPIEFKRAATDFNFAFDFVEENDKYVFAWEYRSDFFSETAIRKFHQILFNATEIQESKLFNKRLNLKSRWNDIVQSFSKKTALIFGNDAFSYSEIDKSICEIREHFKTTGKIDVLILERNKESICDLLFHLIDGIPFIPLDSETSGDRIDQIKHISKDIQSSQAEFNLLQYAIATSGTTGVPKLVGVCKSGFETAVQAWIEDYGMRPEDCCLQAASFSFDVSLGDIGRCFFNGAKMVLLDSSERKDPTLMLDKIREFSVTVFETTPLIIRWWLADNLCLKDLHSLRLLIVGSDSWKMGELRSLSRSKSENQRIISSYGLSETTIDNSFFDSERDNHVEYPNEMVVPIGRAMSHCDLRISDSDGEVLADGMEGFISIIGPAVGLGYFMDGNWTNKQNKIWQSKDRGIRDEWGNFHFKGRSDRQVKIRGQRIELEEIERVLFSLAPELIWSVVDFEHEFSTEMVAFHLGKLDGNRLNQIKTAIIEKYPNYFLPTLFLELDQTPLNTNGKTDVLELRKIAIKKSSSSISFRDDSDTIGRLISHFSQCFNLQINALDNFFKFGKNSFDAMHFVRSWNKIYEEKMAVHQLFSSENFESLARVIDIRKEIQKSGNSVQRISKAQEAIWFEIQNGNSSLFNVPHFIEIPNGFYLEKFKLAFEQTLKMSSALFTRFEETEIGDVIMHTVDSSNYEMPIIELDDLDTFKQNAYIKIFNFLNGLPFEAGILHFQDKKILYFNPHHLVYDGGSDAHLSKIFLEFYEGRTFSEDELLFALPSERISWTNYFQLLPSPEIHFHKADTDLQPSLILACNENEHSRIKELTLAYQCTQAVIISHLLSKALFSIGIDINWISLVIDHRIQDCVGLHMRAYPFPAYDSKLETDLNIAKQKWALSQLFAATDQSIIYPDSTPIEAYNQVGLIIQHPFNIQDYKLEEEKIEYERPRLPISLYVEEINESLFFRWSFDNNQVSKEKIKQLHKSFFKLTEDLAKRNKEILNFKPEAEDILHYSKNGDIQPELENIWTKYVGDNLLKSPHFFEAGANSIKALLMLKEIEKSLKIRISPADFFKQPTLDFLNLSTTKSESNKLVWQIKKSNENEELWLLPPIMGYGFIFNSLESPNKNVLAFNYPLAMGINGSSRIEEIASKLIHERQMMGKLPQHVTILGYSMGGLTAFEMAKWLENNGINVKRLIILDKTAQPESGNKIKRVNLKSELIEIAKQISTDDMDFERIITYLKTHEQTIEKYQQSGYLNCPIDIYYCSDGFQETEFLKWQRFTKQKISLNKIQNCSHYEIPKIWNDMNLNF